MSNDVVRPQSAGIERAHVKGRFRNRSEDYGLVSEPWVANPDIEIGTWRINVKSILGVQGFLTTRDLLIVEGQSPV